MAAGLVKGEEVAIDARIVVADASGPRGKARGEEIDWTSPELNTHAVRVAFLRLDPGVEVLEERR